MITDNRKGGKSEEAGKRVDYQSWRTESPGIWHRVTGIVHGKSLGNGGSLRINGIPEKHTVFVVYRN